jgi:hypothetical protein
MTGRHYTSKDAYTALDSSQDSTDPVGQRIWRTRVPNKVKIFAWLFFRDRLSTRCNLFAKHVLEDDICRRCSLHPEDRGHLFFSCSSSLELWDKLKIRNVTTLTDSDYWTATIPSHLDQNLWPFVLLTLLWRIWDARNGEIFRDEPFSSRRVISKVCDDFVIWEKRLKSSHDVASLRRWHLYLIACNTTDTSVSSEAASE